MHLGGDAHPLIPDLGGPLPLRLRGQACLVAAPRRDAVRDKPGSSQRHENRGGLARGLRGPDRERRVHHRHAQRRRDGQGEHDRPGSGQSQSRKIQGQPEQDAERQRGGAPGRDHPGRGGHHPEHRQRPAPQHNDRDAGQQRDDQPLPLKAPRPGNRREHDSPGGSGQHDDGQPLALRDPSRKPAPGWHPSAFSRMILSHATTVTSASVRRIVPEDDSATSLATSTQMWSAVRPLQPRASLGHAAHGVP